MICRDCRGGYHEACDGHSWCDCQHKASIREVLAREAVEAEAVANAEEAGHKEIALMAKTAFDKVTQSLDEGNSQTQP